MTTIDTPELLVDPRRKIRVSWDLEDPEAPTADAPYGWNREGEPTLHRLVGFSTSYRFYDGEWKAARDPHMRAVRRLKGGEWSKEFDLSEYTPAGQILRVPVKEILEEHRPRTVVTITETPLEAGV